MRASIKLIYGLFIILACNNIAFAEIELPTLKIENEEDMWELYIENKISWDDYYTLNYLYQHPLNLNEAHISQLQELPNVSFDLAQEIYQHRPYKKPEDIIPIIGQDLFEQIKVFIKVRQIWKGDFEFWLTETQHDHKKADLTTRLSLSTNKMEIGSFGERNEKLELKKRYLIWKETHPLIKVIIGNYQARFGEGVVFNTAHQQSYCGVVPDDGNRKRDIQDGILIETSSDNLVATVFYSWVDLDQLPNSTLSEFDDQEKLWGGNLKRGKGDTNIGVTSYVSNFTSQDGKDKRIEMVGLDFLKRFKSAEIAGEIAKSKNQGMGLFLRGDKKINGFKYGLSLRRYEQDFVNPHSKIAEGNEQGGSTKIEYETKKGLKLKVFGDYHQHFSTLLADETYWSSLEYKLSQQAKIMAKIEYEDKDITRDGEQKKAYSVQLETKPHFKLDINSFYKYTKKDEEITDYIYTKMTYYFNPMITLTGRFRYGPAGKRESYAQVKIKRGENELVSKYTHTYPISQSDKFYLKIKTKW